MAVKSVHEVQPVVFTFVNAHPNAVFQQDNVHPHLHELPLNLGQRDLQACHK